MNGRVATPAVIAATMLAGLTLSGCVAAAIPALAAGAMARTQVDPSVGNPDNRIVVSSAPPSGPRESILAPVSALIPPPGTASTPAAAAPAAPATAGEAPAGLAPIDADSLYARFVSHVLERADMVAGGAPVNSLVAANGLLVRERSFVQCPLLRAAVLIDLDDGRSDATSVFMPDGDHSVDPDFLVALGQVRARGVDIVWITDNRTSSAQSISARLQASGLDPLGSDTLLRPTGPDDRKQLRRFRAAQTHCIVAVVGDRRSDADEAYDYLRDPNTPLVIDANWDAGWFILPTPLLPATAPAPTAGEE